MKIDLTCSEPNYFDMTRSLFAGGEVDFRMNLKNYNLDPKKDVIELFHKIRSTDDLMRIFLAVDLIRNISYNIPINLTLPYLPYARQDRYCSEGEPFGLKVFANLLNSQKFNKVKFFDAHSNVATALIARSENISNEKFVFDAFDYLNKSNTYGENFNLVSPDGGAFKKTFDLHESLSKKLPGIAYNSVLPCFKKRTKDGIETIIAGEVYEGFDYVIIDDICDGGRTFINLAKKLKEQGAESVHLIVSHGIFSYGIDVILESGIDSIITTNSWPTGLYSDYIQYSKENLDKLKVFDINNYL